MNTVTNDKIRVVSYLNQFFGGRGGEEAASTPPYVAEGPVGAGRLLQQLLGDRGRVVATVIAGDDHMADHDVAVEDVTRLILDHRPDLVVVGPAFQAGRYGVASAGICASLSGAGVAAVTGLHPENPGVDVERTKVYAVPTGPSAAGMRDAMGRMVRLGERMVRGCRLGTAADEGFIPRGIRQNTFSERNAAERAVELLVRKLRGEPFETEIPLPVYHRVPPSQLPAPLGDLTLAIVSEAGVVPKGNPDRLESARSRRWLTYPLDDLDELSGNGYETIHGGFDNTPISADPNRAIPLDVLREFERAGLFGRLHERYYITTGMTMAIADAERIGREIAADLIGNQIQAAILTAT